MQTRSHKNGRKKYQVQYSSPRFDSSWVRMGAKLFLHKYGVSLKQKGHFKFINPFPEMPTIIVPKTFMWTRMLVLHFN